MPRFLVEVPHEAETIACARAVQLLLQTGSHFLTHAEFGCKDGDHRGWIIVEGETKEEVRNILPAFSDGRIRPVVDKIYPLAVVPAAKAHMEANAHLGKIAVAIPGT